MMKISKAIMYFASYATTTEYPYQSEKDKHLMCLIQVAQSYAALLKLAPEIGALAKIIDTARHETDSTTTIDMALLRQVIDTRPTLKAIHDNLTKWGE